MPRQFYGYPTSIGNKMLSVVGQAGPSSYTQVTTGTIPVTGGATVEAKAFGLKLLDVLYAGMSDTGAYRVEAIPVSDTDNPNGASTSYRLRWVVTATGAEAAAAADLSAQTVRLTAIGPR